MSTPTEPEKPKTPPCPECGSVQTAEHCPGKPVCTWLHCKTCRRPFDMRKRATG